MVTVLLNLGDVELYRDIVYRQLTLDLSVLSTPMLMTTFLIAIPQATLPNLIMKFLESCLITLDF